MSFTKIRYNCGKGILKARIEDENGAKLENWTIMLEDFPKWVRIMCQKYGFKIEPDKTDLDWARKDIM